MWRSLLFGLILSAVLSVAACACTVTTYSVDSGNRQQIAAQLAQRVRQASSSLWIVMPSLPDGALGSAVRFVLDRDIDGRVHSQDQCQAG